MLDPKKEKLRDFRHGNRKWSRRYDEDGGAAIRDLRKIDTRERIFPTRKKISAEERKVRRQEREKAFDERWRTWSKTFFSSVLRRAMFAKEHPNSWVRVSASGEDWKLSPAAAREDLRAHSRMY